MKFVILIIKIINPLSFKEKTLKFNHKNEVAYFNLKNQKHSC